jgi:hypothetical protein
VRSAAKEQYKVTARGVLLAPGLGSGKTARILADGPGALMRHLPGRCETHPLDAKNAGSTERRPISF